MEIGQSEDIIWFEHSLEKVRVIFGQSLDKVDKVWSMDKVKTKYEQHFYKVKAMLWTKQRQNGMDKVRAQIGNT